MKILKRIINWFRKSQIITAPLPEMYTDPKYHNKDSHAVLINGVPCAGGTLYQCVNYIQLNERDMVRKYEHSPYTIVPNKKIRVENKTHVKYFNTWPMSQRCFDEYWKLKVTGNACATKEDIVERIIRNEEQLSNTQRIREELENEYRKATA